VPDKLVTLVLVALLCPAAALAADGSIAVGNAAASPPDASLSVLSFAGFGTLGVVHSSESQADFSNIFQANGAGYTRSWSPTVDSLIAGQVTANFTTRLSAVVQVIAQQRYDNSYWPQVEWANIRYEITPDFSLRAGRIALPVFMQNDSRRIGYANPWVRPPVEVYRLEPVSSSDGVDASFRRSLGSAINTIQLSAGQTDTRFPGANGIPDGVSQSRQVITLVDSVERGFLVVHFTYLHARVTVDAIKPLFDAYRQFGPQGIAIADRYELHDRAVMFLGVGASYDPGKWFVMSEWGHFESHSFSGAANGWYASAGYRLGKVTPYATYASVKARGNTSDPGLDVSSLPPGLATQAGALNAGLNAALGSAPTQQTISLGARWDFRRNMDAKLQIDHSRIGAGSPGLLTNVQPGFRPGGTVNLLSATLDFVF
jgi:hypothetical protein